MTRKHEYVPMTNTPVMRGMQASLENSIICGDCGDKMRQHMPSESVDLIYMDPPFFSGRDYDTVWKDGAEVRQFSDTGFYTRICKCGKVFPENYKFCPICGAGKDESTERRSTDIEAYLQWLRPKLDECHRVLKPTGSIYVHLDWHVVHYVKVMMDEIFGYGNFQNDVIWHYGLGGSSPKRYSRKHDTILFYAKSGEFKFEPPMVRATSQKMKGKMKKADDVWDIPSINNMSKERLGYPTQKPEALLNRIIKASSNSGDLVLDPFCGCGTAVAVAQKLGRRWIGIDVSPTSCKAMSSRLFKLGYHISATGGDVLDMPQTNDQLRTMEPFEFQNWVVTKLGGRQTVRKSGDRGIDGFTFVGDPIQVKRSDKVGANVVRAFTQDVRDVDKTHGIIVAFSYSSGAYEEIDHISAKYGIDIELKTVADMVD